MNWKNAFGRETDALHAYLENPADPEHTAQLVQETDPEELDAYIDTLSKIPSFAQAYQEAQQHSQDVAKEMADYNREMRDAAWDHRGETLQKALYGAGNIATTAGYGLGNTMQNTATGTVSAAGDVGVHTVDAIYDVLDAHSARKQDRQAS